MLLGTAERTSSECSPLDVEHLSLILKFLSPAITLTNCLLRKLPWRRFPIYLVAQFLGGFVGAGIIYANYINGINSFEGGSNLRTVPPAANATGAIFCTYPQADLTKASQFFSEFIASSILMFVIFALKDDSNKGQFSASGSWFPLALFFLIFGLGACFGWNTGYGELHLLKELFDQCSHRASHQPRSRFRPKAYVIRGRIPRRLECGRLLFLDPDGSTILWLPLRWYTVRSLHFHGPDSNQQCMVRAEGAQKSSACDR